MKYLVLIFIFISFTSNRLQLVAIDIAHNGTISVGLGEDYIALIDTENFQVLDKIELDGNPNNEIIKISGNGEHIVWTRQERLFYAQIRKNKIQKPKLLGTSIIWPVDINYDGTQILTSINISTSDECFYNSNRYLIRFQRKDKTFQSDTLIQTNEPCFYMYNGKILPNDGMVYTYSGKSVSHLYEVILDGKTDFGFKKILSPNETMVDLKNGQLITRQIDSLDCSYNLYEQDENGEWQRNIELAKFNCSYSSFFLMSPNGKTVVWHEVDLDKNHRMTQDSKHYIYYKTLKNGQWSAKKVLFDYTFKPYYRFPYSVSISNQNLIFTNSGKQTYLYTTLDENGTLYQIQ